MRRNLTKGKFPIAGAALVVASVWGGAGAAPPTPVVEAPCAPSSGASAPASTAGSAPAATPDAKPAAKPAARPAGGLAAKAGGTVEIEWIRIEGGSFEMGQNNMDYPDEAPPHTVTVPTFELMRTEVTVAQYAACAAAGKCSPPHSGTRCNWRAEGREDHPINCLNWTQANAFARWAKARLPSEAEWTYAARSGGRAQVYPWGDAEATCEYAMMAAEDETSGCGTGGTTAPVCSRPKGNSAQGVCDLSGNVWEWLADWHGPYAEAPADGRPRTRPGTERVYRGGSMNHAPGALRAEYRGEADPDLRGFSVGFRLARDAKP